MVQNNRRQVGMSETELEVGSTEDVEGIKLIDRHVLESVTHTQCRACILQFHVCLALAAAAAAAAAGDLCYALLSSFLFNITLIILFIEPKKRI